VPCAQIKVSQTTQQEDGEKTQQSQGNSASLAYLFCLLFAFWQSANLPTQAHARRHGEKRTLDHWLAPVCVLVDGSKLKTRKNFFSLLVERFFEASKKEAKPVLCAALLVFVALFRLFPFFFLSFILPFGALECSTLFLIVWWFL
jgi:hypothetical protein